MVKVWGMSLGNCRQIVATKFKKDAAKAFGVSVHIFNQYASPTANTEEVALATRYPGTAFVKGHAFTSKYRVKPTEADCNCSKDSNGTLTCPWHNRERF